MQPHNKHHSLAFWNYSFFRALIEFFFPPVKKPLSGKLVVSDAGWSEFSFKHCPDSVFVYFEDDCDPTPCNPGAEDLLEWSVVEYDCYCELVIEWDVASTRTIAWKVC